MEYTIRDMKIFYPDAFDELNDTRSGILQVARAMGGDLTVRANEPSGCVFTLRLPAGGRPSREGASCKSGKETR